MRIINKLLWPIIPLLILLTAIASMIIVINSGTTIGTGIFIFVMSLFFGVLAWILIAVLTKQGSFIDGVLGAIVVWIKRNEPQAFILLGAFAIAFVVLSIGWGISIFNSTSEESIKFIKASMGYEIAFLALTFLWLMLITLAKLKNEPRLTDEIEKQIPLEYIEQNQQAAIEYAFTIFEHKLRDRVNTSFEATGENLINEAFGGNGKLMYSSVKNEQLGIRNLMSGAYAVFRNPRKHRLIEDDKLKTRAIIIMVDLLIHLVNEIEPDKQENK